MVSVIFSASLLGLGYITGAVSRLGERMSSPERFELSQDGETLYAKSGRYDFVGFSDSGEYLTEGGELLTAGRCVGRVSNDDNRKVYILEGEYDRYVMLQNISDSTEVFRLCV